MQPCVRRGGPASPRSRTVLVRRRLGGDRLARPGALARVQTIERHRAASQHEDDDDDCNCVLAAQGIVLRYSPGTVSDGRDVRFREVSMTPVLRYPATARR